jgi:CrcB protein
MAVGLADNRDRPATAGGANSPYLDTTRGRFVRPEPVDQQLASSPSAAAAGAFPEPARPGPARGRRSLLRLRRGLARRWDVLALISLGGAIGSLARWALVEALPHRPSAFPWATALTNVTGCFALGVLMVLALEVWPPSRYVRPFAAVGVLGGYTTFSTAMLETRSLAAAGRPVLAAGYAVGTTLAGLGAVAVAVVLMRVAVRPRPVRPRPVRPRPVRSRRMR